MLPKRKFIKKQYTAPESTQLEEQNLTLSATGDLIEQLKSENASMKGDALSAIANLQVLDNEFEEEIFSASTLIEIINIMANPVYSSMTQTALFALNNLCVNETENHPITKTVKHLFELGLDKALLQLDSTNVNLIKPILILMQNISEYVPKNYRYLVQGIQNTLVSQCEKYLQGESYYDLVLEFLYRSKFVLTPEHPPEISNKIFHIVKAISQMDKYYKNRAIASILFMTMTSFSNPEPLENFTSILEEFLNDIDLQKEYQSNFNKGEQGEIEFEEDFGEGEEEVMEEENKNKGKKKNKGKGGQEEVHESHEEEDTFHLFMDALEGVQIILEFVIENFEQENNFEDEEDDEDEEEMDEEDNVEEEEKNETFDKKMLYEYLGNSLIKVFPLLEKFSYLTFIEGQNIIELILRLILSLPKELIGLGKIPANHLVILSEKILVHEFNLIINSVAKIPEDVIIFNTKLVFDIILTHKQISNREIYPQLPELVSGVNKIPIMKINAKWKECWICLLEIYSIFYNPEKNKSVTLEETTKISKTLKHLLINIPELELEEWRAQTIDTLFDIFSNEMFDTLYVEFGFGGLLEHILKSVNVPQKKQKKRNKFINDVLTDIKRFIDYKRKMIK